MKKNTGKKLFISICVIFLPLMLIASQDAGLIWDEWVQSHYGKLALKFFLTGGADREFMAFAETMYLYGGFFDSLSGLIYGLTHNNLQEFLASNQFHDVKWPHYFEMRHALNAVFGFIAILFTGLLGQKIGGWTAGNLSLIFCVLSPRFFGHSMNNPKDIPFAAGYVISLYALCRLFKEWPKLKLKTAVFMTAGFALALNMKAGGLILFCYLYLFTAVYYLICQFKDEPCPPLFPLGRWLLAVTLLGYFGGLLLWPYGILDPLRHPFTALQGLSNFSGAKGTLLFEGALFKYGHTPVHYIPKWIFITVPLFIHLGLAGILFQVKNIFRGQRVFLILMLLFAAIFPPFYAVIKKSVVYDGWRHFLFIYPPLAVLAAYAWALFMRRAKRPWVKSLLLIFLTLNLAEPAAFTLRNHPHEYVYFNPLAGGLRGAYGYYETDYWGNSLKEASEWIADYHRRNHPGETVVITADGSPLSSAYYLLRDLPKEYIDIAKKTNRWDYWLSLSRGIAPKDLQNGKWPPEGTIYTVEADGVPLCAVVKNLNKAESSGAFHPLQ